MKDERIETTVNRVVRPGFVILYFLMMISLDYRILILKQPLRDYWDFFAIWVIVSVFGFVALASKGVFAHNFKRYFLSLAIFLTIFLVTLNFIKGHIHSVGDVGVFLIGTLPALGLVVGIAYLLNRRWERKEGIEDEE